jgi:hypothetical protein
VQQLTLYLLQTGGGGIVQSMSRRHVRPAFGPVHKTRLSGGHDGEPRARTHEERFWYRARLDENSKWDIACLIVIDVNRPVIAEVRILPHETHLPSDISTWSRSPRSIPRGGAGPGEFPSGFYRQHAKQINELFAAYGIRIRKVRRRQVTIDVLEVAQMVAEVGSVAAAYARWNELKGPAKYVTFRSAATRAKKRKFLVKRKDHFQLTQTARTLLAQKEKQ